MKRGKSGVVALVICFVVMIAIVGTITFQSGEKKAEDGQLAKTEEDKTEAKEDDEEESKEEEPVQVTQVEQIEAQTEKQLSFYEDNSLYWPIEGNVIMNYSMDETIYFATLDQYKYHPAIVISGEIGQEVWSVKDGKITEIKTDAQTGTTVKMDLGDGFEAVYGQLSDVQKSEGETVIKGELLGYLSEPTKYYSVEGSNLYFQLLKDGQPVNPLEYLEL